ncbi:MAG: sugar phosphate isomerase/epimerase [Candidatus Sumerlaeota bacterium]|nr:sugar phosphate isomerase/epimerase [Candidatus Sumerlaeota bacterium]
MKLGIRSICVSKDFVEAMRISKEAGLDGIQIASGEARMYEASDAELLAFKKRVNDAGLEIASSSAGPNLVNPAAAEKSLEQMQKLIHAAAVMGYGIVTGEVKALPAGMAPEEGWKSCVATVKRVCEMCDREGVVYGVEPGGNCLVRTTDDLERLLREVGHPRLAVNFDGGNLWHAGSDALEAARRLAQHIRHVHTKDWSRAEGKEMALGDGEVDYAAILRVLRKAGYDGWLVIERERTADPESDTIKAAARLKGILRGL